MITARSIIVINMFGNFYKHDIVQQINNHDIDQSWKGCSQRTSLSS